MPDLRLGKQSRHDQERAVEEGIEIIRQAIKSLLSKPQNEREKVLAGLSEELEHLAVALTGCGAEGPASQRVQATRNVIKLLQRASSAARPSK